MAAAAGCRVDDCFIACAGNSDSSREDLEEFVKEVEMMASLSRHSNVIQLVDCACSSDGTCSRCLPVSPKPVSPKLGFRVRVRVRVAFWRIGFRRNGFRRIGFRRIGFRRIGTEPCSPCAIQEFGLLTRWTKPHGDF